MNILLVLNCHSREFPARMAEVSRLVISRPDDSFVVATTAKIDLTAHSRVTNPRIDVVPVSSFINSRPHAQDAPQQPSGVLHSDTEAALWRLFVSDRHIFDVADIGRYATRSHSLSDVRGAFAAARSALARMFAGAPIDLVLPGAPDNYLSAMSIELAVQRSIPVAFWGGSEVAGPGRRIIYDSLSLGNARLFSCLARGPVAGDSEAEEEVERSTSIASLLRRDLEVLPFAVGRSGRAGLEDYGRGAVQTIRSCIGSRRDSRGRSSAIEMLLGTTEGTGFEAVSRFVAWIGRRQRNHADLARLSASIPRRPWPAQKVVLVPLHFQPEAYVTFSVPELANQVMWVRLLSLTLPPNVVVAVKEHPAQDPGWRPDGFYRQLATLPRVVLLNPLISSNDLLRRQEIDMVCTLGGSMAIEARVAGCRVSSVIPSVSASFPGVCHLSPFSLDFGEALRDALDAPSTAPSRTEIDSWFRCVDACTVPDGSFATMSAELIDWAQRR